MYGVYDTGPWLGIKMRGNDFVGWIGGGTRTFDLMVGEYNTSPASFLFRSGDTLACLSTERPAGSNSWKMGSRSWRRRVKILLSG